MYKVNLALNNLQWLICHQTQLNHSHSDTFTKMGQKIRTISRFNNFIQQLVFLTTVRSINIHGYLRVLFVAASHQTRLDTRSKA